MRALHIQWTRVDTFGNEKQASLLSSYRIFFPPMRVPNIRSPDYFRQPHDCSEVLSRIKILRVLAKTRVVTHGTQESDP
jgi:hypothetical protein